MPGVVSLASSAPGRRVRVLAMRLAGLLFLTFLAALPLSPHYVGRIDSFVPMVVASIIVLDVMTAYVFFDEFVQGQRPGVLVLGAAYLFSACMAVPYALSFPRAFSHDIVYLIGDVQSAAWLYIIWHTIFPAAIVVYVFLKNGKTAASYRPDFVVAAVVAGCLAAVAAISFAALNAEQLLPPVRPGEVAAGMTIRVAAAICAAPAAFGLILLWRRPKTTLDVWLMMVLLAAVFEPVLLGLVPGGRFTVGFYASRFYGVLGSGIILLATLMETRSVYRRLYVLASKLRHEQQNRLMTLDAVLGAVRHELRQPMAAIRFNAGAGVLLLNRDVDRAEVGECLQTIIEDTSRLESVVSNIGGAVGASPVKPRRTDVNLVVRRALEVVQRDLEANGVSVSMNLGRNVPAVSCDPGHLLEIVVNVAQNAIDALRERPENMRRLSCSTRAFSADRVECVLEDSAGGIEPSRLDKIFEPFVTTKPAGMGLGLAICRSIVEQYGGRISASNGRAGAIFKISLSAWKPVGEDLSHSDMQISEAAKLSA